jgi:6-pyruvoyltetrahydropterin/6-carboxytetrahydropterin synthase
VYHIGLFRPFRALHFLIGGDWGPENNLHSHDYKVEWDLQGPDLDDDGFLLDLVAVEGLLDEALDEIRGRTLNDLTAFRGLNPSVERLSRFLSDRLLEQRPRWDPRHRLRFSVVKVFENDSAWAAWSADLTGPAEAP